MSKKEAEIGDLLGEPAAKKAPAKKAAEPKVEKPAAKKAAPAKKAAAVEPEKKPVAKKAAAPKKEPAAEKTAREPVRFVEGERQGIYDKVTAHFKRSKKPINSRELAEKLSVDTRKLRIALYSLAKKEDPVVTLALEGSKVAGMTVSPA